MENVSIAARHIPLPVACIQDRKLGERATLMSASTLFAGLSIPECVRIGSSATLRTFSPDEYLFRQGEVGRSLMLIQYGRVKLTQLSSTGNEVILWMTGERQPIGILLDPMQNNSRYTCSAQAMDRVSTVVWDYDRLRSILEQYPRIRANMNSILSARLEELQERFREIATERVPKRLAMALLRLSKQVGKPHADGVQVLLSREELAQLVGTTLFTISRILSRWDEDGVVLARREAVVVRNPAYLQSHPDLD